MPGKGPRMAADVFAVKPARILALEAKRLIIRMQVEADAKQAARAVRGLGADDVVGQGRKPVAAALQVEAACRDRARCRSAWPSRSNSTALMPSSLTARVATR